MPMMGKSKGLSCAGVVMPQACASGSKLRNHR